LITPYWKSKFTHILKDVHTAILKNLVNRHIHKIYLLCEDHCYQEEFLQLGFPHVSKLIFLNLYQRAKFSDVFMLISKLTTSGETNGIHYIICNSDIYFDESLKFINGIDRKKTLKTTVYALSKWYQQSDETNTMELTLRTDSQDAWIIINNVYSESQNINEIKTQKSDGIFGSSFIPTGLISDSNFYIGSSRCDNVLANLFEQYDFIIRNPAIKVHAIEVNSGPNMNNMKLQNGRTQLSRYHHDMSNNHESMKENRNLYSTENAVSGPTSRVYLSLPLFI